MNDNNIRTTSCKREHIYIAAISERNDNNIRTTSCKQRTYMQDSQMCPVPQTCPIPQACSITSPSHKRVRFSPQTRLIWLEGKRPPHWRHNITTKYTAVQNMDETIPDIGFSIGTFQRKKLLSKDTNPETTLIE
jgi:hypothetical protein